MVNLIVLWQLGYYMLNFTTKSRGKDSKKYGFNFFSTLLLSRRFHTSTKSRALVDKRQFTNLNSNVFYAKYLF